MGTTRLLGLTAFPSKFRFCSLKGSLELVGDAIEDGLLGYISTSPGFFSMTFGPLTMNTFLAMGVNTTELLSIASNNYNGAYTNSSQNSQPSSSANQTTSASSGSVNTASGGTFFAVVLGGLGLRFA